MGDNGLKVTVSREKLFKMALGEMEQLNKCYDFLTVCRPDVKPELLVQVGYSPVVIGPHVGQLSDCRPHCEAAVAVLRRLV